MTAEMWHRGIMTFPWTNLITAISTLFAALGATYVKAAFDARNERRRFEHESNSRRAEVRAEAYSNFLKVAHADARLLGQTLLQYSLGAPDKAKLDQIMMATSVVIDEFNDALARVEIVGSSRAALAESQVAAAARALGARCSSAYLHGGPFDTAAAEAELGELSRAIASFASSCRHELSSGGELDRAM